MNTLTEKQKDQVVKYDRKTVQKSTLKYFHGDELATSVWMDNYCLKDDKGNFYELNPNDMHKRLAREFAKKFKERGDNLLSEDKLYEYFKDFKNIIPQGSIMSQLGNKLSIGSLSNCTVIAPPVDSYGGIFYTDQQIAQLEKRRCGVGTDISSLRPAKTKVTNAAGTSTGAVSFMSRFSHTTNEVGQDGRRGALMLSISVLHPDVKEFIKSKEDRTKITGANISVQLTDDFMDKVINDKLITLRYPVTLTDEEIKDGDYCKTRIFETDKLYQKLDGSKKYIKYTRAKEIWNLIVQMAWDNAEPGIIFKDKHHKYSLSSLYPEYENITTNPCGEIMMGKNDSCRLVANNAYGCLIKPFTSKVKFDMKKWEDLAYNGLLINDALVDLELDSIQRIIDKINADPEEPIIKAVELQTWRDFYQTGADGRRTGLGLTGLADTLAGMGFKYDSKEAMEFVDKLMLTKLRGELRASIDLAKIHGPFKGFDPKIEEKSEFTQMIKKELPSLYKDMMKYGRRNVSLSTLAPTGTLSMLAQVSSGMEPVFSLAYKRRRKIMGNEDIKPDFIDDNGEKWIEFNVYHHKLYDWALVNGYSDNINEIESIDLTDRIESSPYFNATAPDIKWEQRVEMQSILQRYTSHSISSTINLPKDISVGTINEIFIKSWEKGLKGITVYRDGSRDGVLLVNDEKLSDLDENGRPRFIKHSQAPKRPIEVRHEIHNLSVLGIKWTVFVGMIEDINKELVPYEVFAFKKKNLSLPAKVETGILKRIKSGRYDFIADDGLILENVADFFDRDEQEALTRSISLSLRHGADIKHVVEQLNKSEGTIVSFSKAIARTLKKYIKDGTATSEKCSNCGNELVFEEGCKTCKTCGFSKCG
jgi:ribonucleoside-diphosphate reductase alpha chain